MTSLTIRNIAIKVKDRLRIRAARNRRSLEAEMRAMITEAATADAPRQLNLAEAIRRRMAPLGGAGDLPPHPSANATVATRDTAGFENCGIAAINPWLPQ